MSYFVFSAYPRGCARALRRKSAKLRRRRLLTGTWAAFYILRDSASCSFKPAAEGLKMASERAPCRQCPAGAAQPSVKLGGGPGRSRTSELFSRTRGKPGMAGTQALALSDEGPSTVTVTSTPPLVSRRVTAKPLKPC